MSGFCFSKSATSSFHSLCRAGELAGGAQSTLIVTCPFAAPPVPDALPVPDELPLEHAAAATRTAVAASARGAECLRYLRSVMAGSFRNETNE